MRTPARLRFVLLAALSVLALGACTPDEEKLAEHMRRADAYRDQEQFNEAIIEYKNVLQIDPNHADAHYGLSQAYLKTQQPREGFWELRETVRLDPDNMRARLQFGQISAIAGELEEALKQAEQVVEAEPENLDALLLRAQSLEALKRPSEAGEAYARAVEVAPEDGKALLQQANFHRRRGRDEDAEPLYRRLVEIDPSFRSTSILAAFLSTSQRDEEAEGMYRKALELAEEPADKSRAYQHLASFLFIRDRGDEAIALLREGIEAQEDPLDLIYLQARFHRARKEFAEADQLIEQATSARPDDPRPFLILSNYRGRKGDQQGALDAARKALEIDPTNRQARLRTAEVLVEVGFAEGSRAQIAEGRSIVDAVLAQEPSDPGALFVKAKLDMADQRVDDAIATLRQAIDARPDWAQAHFVLGAALALTGERTAARTELARALEIDAGLLEAHKVLAQVHAGLREHEYAVESGRRYLRERPGDVDTRILVAQSLVRMGQVEEALKELEAIREEDRNPEVLYAFGRIHLGLGRDDEGREFLMRAHEAVPQNADILGLLLILDLRQNRFDESAERISAALEKDPNDSRLHRLRGVVALQRGQTSDAERAFKKAIDLNPNDLANYEQLARYYAAVGQTEQTIETYERAVKVRPQEANLHHFLGVLYELQGQSDLAIARYEEAIKYDPNLGEARNNLAYIYAEKGENLDRALDLAQEAKALLPESPNAADTLGWVLYKRGIPSAAISYLKEAEAGTEPGDPALGVVRTHLAQAYEANGEVDSARETLERALADFQRSQETIEASGGAAPSEPAWVPEARTMLGRLETSEVSASEG